MKWTKKPKSKARPGTPAKNTAKNT